MQARLRLSVNLGKNQRTYPGPGSEGVGIETTGGAPETRKVGGTDDPLETEECGCWLLDGWRKIDGRSRNDSLPHARKLDAERERARAIRAQKTEKHDGYNSVSATSQTQSVTSPSKVDIVVRTPSSPHTHASYPFERARANPRAPCEERTN
ncbi:hypothetical protein MHYP_G00329380 [Metynnis hypsauchen]